MKIKTKKEQIKSKIKQNKTKNPGIPGLPPPPLVRTPHPYFRLKTWKGGVLTRGSTVIVLPNGLYWQIPNGVGIIRIPGGPRKAKPVLSR